MPNRCATTTLLIVIALFYSFKAWRKRERCEAGLCLAYVALAITEYLRV